VETTFHLKDCSNLIFFETITAEVGVFYFAIGYKSVKNNCALKIDFTPSLNKLVLQLIEI
jgi:hypothetical protein